MVFLLAGLMGGLFVIGLSRESTLVVSALVSLVFCFIVVWSTRSEHKRLLNSERFSDVKTQRLFVRDL
jgi:hypothetical protein